MLVVVSTLTWITRPNVKPIPTSSQQAITINNMYWIGHKLLINSVIFPSTRRIWCSNIPVCTSLLVGLNNNNNNNCWCRVLGGGVVVGHPSQKRSGRQSRREFYVYLTTQTVTWDCAWFCLTSLSVVLSSYSINWKSAKNANCLL